MLILFLSGGILPGRIKAEDSPGTETYLYFTQWSAEAYAEKASGTLCWIGGADGSLRVEVLRNDQVPTETAAALAPLLDRIGMGWTLVVGPDLNGTMNPWGDQWRQVPAGLAQLVRLVTTVLPGYPDPPARFPFAKRVDAYSRGVGIPRPRVLGNRVPDTGNIGTWRYQLAPLVLEDQPKPTAQPFRRQMTSRGRGTGGVGEILVLRWERPAGREGYGLDLSSSRRPGRLHLAPAGQLAVPSPEPEVFLPLWPMSQFLTNR